MDNLSLIVPKIDNLLKNKDYIVIAIDGDSASGKSSLALSLFYYYKNEVNVIHIDDFYLANQGNIDMNNINKMYDGNIDYNKLKEEVINNLSKTTFSYSIFDCKNQVLNKEKVVVNKKRIMIIEGSYSLNASKLGKYYDFSIFLKIDKSLQIERLKNRNKNNFNDFLNKWIVLEKNYQEHYKIEKNCDFLINVS